MGIQINGSNDSITAVDGSLSLSGAELASVSGINVSGVITATTGSFSGTITANAFSGDGSSLTGVASTDNIRTNTNATFLQNVNVTGAGITVGVTTITSSSLAVNGINYPAVGPLSNRNIIINGAMQVAQRGTSQSGLTDSGVYLVDRFAYRRGGAWGTNSFTMSQQSSGAPDGFTHFLRLAQSGTAAAPPTDADCRIGAYLEGRSVAHAAFGTSAAQPLTLSFWVRASQAGTYCVSLGNGNGQSYIEEYSVTTSWQRVIVNIPARTAGTWTTDSSAGYYFHWIVAADSDGNQSGSSGWTATDNRYTTNQIETFASTSGATFDLTGVQLEIGEVATPFEYRSFGDELLRCQRYYSKAYSYQDAPGTNTSDSLQGLRNWDTSGRTDVPANVRFPVEMRAAPSVTIYSRNGTVDNVSESGDGFTHANNKGLNAIRAIGRAGYSTLSLSSAIGSLQFYIWFWTADTEL